MGQAGSEGASGGFGWRKLLGYAAIAAAVVIALASVFVFKGIDPPFILLIALFSVGGILSLRTGKLGVTGVVLATLGGLMFSGFTGPFVVSLLQTPEAKEVIPVISTFLLAVTVVVSAIILAVKGKGRSLEPSSAARYLGLTVVGLIVVIGAWNIYMISSFESEAAESGDLRVVMEDFEFSPDPVQASGGTVGVHVTNKDDTLHTFTIKELGVDLAVPGGKSARVSFSAEPGEYRVSCEPHAPDMKAKLQVA